MAEARIKRMFVHRHQYDINSFDEFVIILAIIMDCLLELFRVGSNMSRYCCSIELICDITFEVLAGQLFYLDDLGYASCFLTITCMIKVPRYFNCAGHLTITMTIAFTIQVNIAITYIIQVNKQVNNKFKQSFRQDNYL